MAHFQDRDICGGGYAGQKMALVLWRSPDGKRELGIVRKPSPPPGGMKSNGPMAAAGAFICAGWWYHTPRLQSRTRLRPWRSIGLSPAEVGRRSLPEIYHA